MQKNPNSLTVTVAPFRRDVPDKTPTLVWETNGNGTTFPSTNFFSWKSGGSGTPVRSSDGRTLTLAYTQTTPSDWTYSIALENDGVRVDIDPEIHNDPPTP
jgi:hypothetical protein